MSSTTHKMLRVMLPSTSKSESGNTTKKTVPPIDELSEKHPQLTPSLSMMDVLNHCLSPNKKLDNTPLR